MRFNAISHLAAALFVGLVVTGAAQAADTPATFAGTKLVSAADVAKVQAGGAVVIDSRVAAEYAEGHIKGAINVPYREKSAKAVDFDASQDEFSLAKLPTDKAARGRHLLQRARMLEELQGFDSGDQGRIHERPLVPRRLPRLEVEGPSRRIGAGRAAASGVFTDTRSLARASADALELDHASPQYQGEDAGCFRLDRSSLWWSWP